MDCFTSRDFEEFVVLKKPFKRRKPIVKKEAIGKLCKVKNSNESHFNNYALISKIIIDNDEVYYCDSLGFYWDQVEVLTREEFEKLNGKGE